MPDFIKRLRELDRIEPPDVWSAVERMRPRTPTEPSPSLSRRAAILLLALALAVGGFLFVDSAFRGRAVREPGQSSSTELTSTTPAIDVEEVVLEAPLRLGVAPRGGLASMVEAFGSVWVIGGFQQPDSGVETLRRLDLADGSIQARFDLPVRGGGEWGGDGLTVGAGYVWATAWNGATIFRVDPTDNSVTQFRLDGIVVSDLAFDQQTEELWATVVTNVGERFLLVRIDPSDGTVLSSTPYDAAWSGGLMSIQGSVWILGRHVKNSTVLGGFLHQLVPGIAPDVETGGSFALPVTDGRWIWTPASGDDRAMNLSGGIAQVDPSDGSVLQSWDVNNIGYDVAIGPDGGVWFLGTKGLERLNPTAGEVQSWKAADDAEEPIFIVPSSDGVWVGTYEGALFFRPFANQG